MFKKIAVVLKAIFPLFLPKAINGERTGSLVKTTILMSYHLLLFASFHGNRGVVGGCINKRVC